MSGKHIENRNGSSYRYSLLFVSGELREKCYSCQVKTSRSCCQTNCELFKRAVDALKEGMVKIDICHYCPSRNQTCFGMEYVLKNRNYVPHPIEEVTETKITERFYAGIGSRKTPANILSLMNQLAEILDKKYTVRSGGADGADTAFEIASHKEIFLPWEGFNGKKGINARSLPVFWDAQKIAKKHHPAWEKLNHAGRLLMTRNVFQILGRDLQSPSEFVICWTPNGKITGGTGTAIRIARAYEVPVYNLARAEDSEKLAELIQSMK